MNRIFVLLSDVTHKKILSTKDTKSTKKRLSYGIFGEKTDIKFAVRLSIRVFRAFRGLLLFHA